MNASRTKSPTLQSAASAYNAWRPSPRLRDYPTVNRFLSAQLTRFLVRTPLKPNQVTVIAFAVGAAGIWCFAQGKNPWWLFGALFFQLQYVLDNCDGEIARAKNLVSRLGYWLDQLLDMTLHVLLFPALAFGLWRYADRPGHVMWLGIAAALGVTCVFLLFTLCPQNQRRTGRGSAVPPRSSGFKRLLERLTEGDFSFLIILVAALGGLPIGGITVCEGFVWAAGLGAPLFAVAVAVLGVREAAT